MVVSLQNDMAQRQQDCSAVQGLPVPHHQAANQPPVDFSIH